MLEFDRDNDEVIAQFIDKYVCTGHAEQDDKELHDIVGEVQMHSRKHTKSCKKGNRVCRFKFPGPPSCRTFVCRPVSCPPDTDESDWTKHAEDILKKVMHETQKDKVCSSTEDLFNTVGISQQEYEQAWSVVSSKVTIVYERKPHDVWVNQYNPHLLKAWNANCDLQFVIDPYSCTRYIVSYISKKESEEGQLLRNMQEALWKEQVTARSELQQLGKLYMTHREISVMEAVYRATGMHLKQCSRDVIWLPTDASSTRLTLPLSVLRQKDPESEEVWAVSVIDRYHARPVIEEFNDMCLAEFTSCYRITKRAKVTEDEFSVDNKDDDAVKLTSNDDSPKVKLQNNLGFVIKRTVGREAIILFPKFSASTKPAQHYQNLMMLYLPKRSRNYVPTEYDLFEEYYTCGSVLYL